VLTQPAISWVRFVRLDDSFVDCDVVAMLPAGWTLRERSAVPRIVHLAPRYVGKEIGLQDTEATNATCSWTDADASGLARVSVDPKGTVLVQEFEYPG
jgi:hypothetical protein